MSFATVPDPTPEQIRERAAEIRAKWSPEERTLRRGVHHTQIKRPGGQLLDLQLAHDGGYSLPVYCRGIEWVDDRA